MKLEKHPMYELDRSDRVNSCCRQYLNLERIETESEDLVKISVVRPDPVTFQEKKVEVGVKKDLMVEICRVCNRRHFILTASPAKMKIASQSSKSEGKKFKAKQLTLF